MSVPPSGVRLVGLEPLRIGLNDLPSLEEQHPDFFGRHARHESFGVVQRFAQTAHDSSSVDGRFARDALKVGGGVAGVAAYFVDQAFRGEPGGLLHRGPNDRAKRQDFLVNGYRIDDVARFAPTCRRHHFVGRQIDRMQDVTELLVLLNRKKPEIAVDDPLQLGRLIRCETSA